jgi:hypothetical protein
MSIWCHAKLKSKLRVLPPSSWRPVQVQESGKQPLLLALGWLREPP